MSEETENDVVDEAEPKAKKPDGPLAGERLAEARREQQISVLEVAKELHLDEPKVRALEQNNFDMLGAPVFAKGHLRKYASLVGVDMDDVLQDYYRLTRAAGMPPVVGRVRKPAREISPGPWIAAVLILIIVAAAYWWFFARDTGPDFQQPELPPSQPVDDGGANDADNFEAVEVTMPDASEQDMVEPAIDEEPVVQQLAAVPPPVLAIGQVRLSLSFSGECWTEITDATGQRLFFDLGRDGRNVNVSGEAPLSVLFGNADNVSVQVNGRDYAISPASRRGETASFTIASP